MTPAPDDFGPAVVDTGLDSRSVSFENPTGGRGAGGAAGAGRKGAPSRRVRAGERVVLADLEGPGIVRHIWMTFPPAPPQEMRGVWMEIFYDDATAPSVSVPCLDFFGVPHGRPVPYASALTTMPEGRGLNAFFPMPFRGRMRVELTNGSSRAIQLYYQIDYTRQDALPADVGVLHCAFRRENPTTMGRDFVIADVPAGPGRFLGCVVGVRVVDEGTWYGEGEVKIFRDGDRDLPTICGTGLEDYVGSAWGMGAHHGPYAGAPLVVDRLGADSIPLSLPAFVGFYRWHVVDPIVFTDELRVTIQQIGMHTFPAGATDQFERFAASHPQAGDGWFRGLPNLEAIGLHERVDDYSAAAFFYCTTPQPVDRLDVAGATADLGRLAHERADPMESFFR
ncbi:MAG: hypothetical protein QOF28_1296 [Actinomycetota bacterium]|nr:hypothetical protein [Actinomycetota bacterium]